MSRFHSHINTAAVLLNTYRGDIPFAVFSRQFFAKEKKYGSKDRKQIVHLCYCVFRTGHLLASLPSTEKITAALFLCSTSENELLKNLLPQLHVSVTAAPEEKLLLLGLPAGIKNIFPWRNLCSNAIDENTFCNSLLQQPDVFIRVRPGYEKMVEEKIKAAGIAYKNVGTHSIALPNGTKIEAVIETDKEAVIQDLSSQHTADLLLPFVAIHEKINVWDCCVASGGKSILLYDVFKHNLQLSVSDSRPTVLSQLKQRFEKAGIKNYDAFTADLSLEKINMPVAAADLIVCDAPCSGSGTWSRTPEQLYFFKEKKVIAFATLQKKIVSNVIPQLKKGGQFLYITCSVFKNENEDVAAFIQDECGLRLVKMELLKGYRQKADSMFVALFEK